MPNLTTWIISLADNISYTLFVRDVVDNRQMEFFETSKVYKQDSQPTPIAYAIWYSPRENKWRYILSDTSNGWLEDWSVCEVATFSGKDGRITSFKPKTVFQAADRNDTEWASLSGKPSNRYIDLNLEASGTTYIAPVNGWICLDKATGTADTFIAIEVVKKGTSEKIYGTRHIAQNPAFNISDILPVLKGEEFKVYYNMTGDTSIFRFIYDNGVK